MRRNRLISGLLLILFVVVTARLFVQFGSPLFSYAQNQNQPAPAEPAPGETGSDDLGPHAAFFDYAGNVKIATLVKGKTTKSLPITVMMDINISVDEAQAILNAVQGLRPIIRIVGVTYDTQNADIDELTSVLRNPDVNALIPEGTLVVFGNELNNLDREYDVCPGSVCADRLGEAGEKYGGQFTLFADAAYRFTPVPAPPDMYNGNYGWSEFTNAAGVYGGPLVANVYDAVVPDRPENGGKSSLELYNQLGTVVAFTEYGPDPSKATLQEHIDFFLQNPPAKPATTLIPDRCKSSDHTTDQWLFYIQGKIYDQAGFEIDPASCGSTGRGEPPAGDYYQKFVFPFYPATQEPQQKTQTMLSKLQKDYSVSCVRPADYESFITSGIEQIFDSPYGGVCKGKVDEQACLFEPFLNFSITSDSPGQMFGTLRDEVSAKWRAYDYSQDSDPAKRNFTSRFESVEQWFGANNPDTTQYRNTTPEEIKETHQGPYYKLAGKDLQCFAAAEIMNATDKLCQEWQQFKSPQDPRTECPLIVQPVSGSGQNMGQLIAETKSFMDQMPDLRVAGMTDAQSICQGYFGTLAADATQIDALRAVAKPIIDKILKVDLYMETAYRPAFLVMTTELDNPEPSIGPGRTGQFLTDAEEGKPYSKHVVDYLIYHVPSTITDMDSQGFSSISNDTSDHQDIITRTIRLFTPLEETKEKLTAYKQQRDEIQARINELPGRKASAPDLLEINCTEAECDEPVRRALTDFINAYMSTADGATLEGCKNLDRFIEQPKSEHGNQIGSKIDPSGDLSGLNEDKSDSEASATDATTGDLSLKTYYDRNGTAITNSRPRTQTRIYNVSPYGFRTDYNAEGLLALFQPEHGFGPNKGYYRAFSVEFEPNFQTTEDTQNYYNADNPDTAKGGIVQIDVNGGAKIREEQLPFTARFGNLARVFNLSTRAVVQNITGAGTAIINCAQQITDPNRNTEEFLLKCGRGGSSGSGGGGNQNQNPAEEYMNTPVAVWKPGCEGYPGVKTPILYSANVCSGPTSQGGAADRAALFVDAIDISQWKNSNDGGEASTLCTQALYDRVGCSYNPDAPGKTPGVNLIAHKVDAKGNFTPDGTMTACEYVVNQAKAQGVSPKFALAMWGEESNFGAFSTTKDGYDFGVISQPPSRQSGSLKQQLEKFLSTVTGQTNYLTFLRRYSGERTASERDFCNNPQFPYSLFDFYQRVVD